MFHYCLNDHINGTGDFNKPVRLASLSTPSSLVWLFDTKNLPAVGTWSFTHTNLHRGGAQFLFLDGHAVRYRATEYWDLTANKPRTNNESIRWIP